MSSGESFLVPHTAEAEPEEKQRPAILTKGCQRPNLAGRVSLLTSTRSTGLTTPSWLVCTVMAYTNDLVAVLKSEIERLEATPVWQQQLLIDGWSLEDRESLKSYCFDENRSGVFWRVVLLTRWRPNGSYCNV